MAFRLALVEMMMMLKCHESKYEHETCTKNHMLKLYIQIHSSLYLFRCNLPRVSA